MNTLNTKLASRVSANHRPVVHHAVFHTLPINNMVALPTNYIKPTVLWLTFIFVDDRRL